jgi:hypothetical protein
VLQNRTILFVDNSPGFVTGIHQPVLGNAVRHVILKLDPTIYHLRGGPLCQDSCRLDSSLT